MTDWILEAAVCLLVYLAGSIPLALFAGWLLWLQSEPENEAEISSLKE